MTALQTPTRLVWAGLRPRRLRTIRQFAEQEIVLPSPSPSGRRRFDLGVRFWPGGADSAGATRE